MKRRGVMNSTLILVAGAVVVFLLFQYLKTS